MEETQDVRRRDGGPVRGREEGAGYRLYLRTWFILLVLTAMEIGVVLMRLAPRSLTAILLAFTVLKIFFIAFDFMHLRFERAGLVVIFVLPFLAGLLLYFGVAPDFGLFLGVP